MPLVVWSPPRSSIRLVVSPETSTSCRSDVPSPSSSRKTLSIGGCRTQTFPSCAITPRGCSILANTFTRSALPSPSSSMQRTTRPPPGVLPSDPCSSTATYTAPSGATDRATG